MNKSNDTTKIEELQAEANNLFKKIEKHIPANLDESAKKYGALVRKRGIQSAVGLLRILLIYSTSKMSIKLLALASCVLNISNISDTALRKRIASSVSWLQYLLNTILKTTIEPQSNPTSKNRNTFVIDGTCFRQEGKNGKIYRAHMSYCLNTGCMNEVKVTDNHTAESLQIYGIEKNGIYIADAGYGKSNQIGYVMSKGADVIFRVTPNHITFFNENKNKIDMTELLKTKQLTLDISCYINYQGKFMPVRIIASRLPDDKIEAAVNRKKRKAQKNQSKIKPETLLYAEWVIIVTSLSSEYSKEEILDIYRSRWQVELLFKRIKQNIQIRTIRPCLEDYARTLIHLWLIVWAITEKQVLAYELLLVQKHVNLQQVSLWNTCALFFMRTVSMIQDHWSLLVDVSNIELINKYLLNHKYENRRNQFADFILCNISPSVA